jgi:serine/threonine-protein kinase
LVQETHPYAGLPPPLQKPIGYPGNVFLPGEKISDPGRPHCDDESGPDADIPVALPAHLKPLEDKFEFLERLGGGGFGEVWRVRVRHSVLDVERAVKVIKAEAANNREHIERMVREAKAMARLNHPHAVAVHNADRDPAYIEMDYIRGKTLEKVLREQGPCRPMSLEWTAQFLKQLCSVLQLAHKNHIIHRDLKPSNLMLADDGDAEGPDLKVLDFGIAKLLNPAPGAFETQGNAPLTPQYTSPEQARDDAPPDARSDIFAVGLILYQLLTGHHPFWSPGDSIYCALAAIFSEPTPPFRERNPDVCVPEGIERLVLRCLEKDPARRPASAAALAEEFQHLVNLSRLRHEPVPPKPVPPVPRRWQRLRRVAVVVVGTLGAFLGTCAATWFSIKPVHDHLVIRAGTDYNTIDFVDFVPDSLSQYFTINVVEPLPEGIKVEKADSTESAPLQFRVEIAPEFVPGDTPVLQQLAFDASFRWVKRRLTVKLEIWPPDLVRLPGQWVRSPSSELVRIGGKHYPKEIKREVGGFDVVALLIDRSDNARPGVVQPEPFYIMKDKVWVGLFEVFAREQPEAVREPAWRQGSDPLVPVFNITGPQAEAFAAWLAGADHGFLPTLEQWDQAAGRNRIPARPGPFEPPPWEPSDVTPVAVGLLAPLAVGVASRDKSPYGCRDMSGNGWEWTRRSDGDAVTLRAQSFKETKRFVFDDIDKKLLFAQDFKEHDNEIGFRVVIQIDPSGQRTVPIAPAAPSPGDRAGKTH